MPDIELQLRAEDAKLIFLAIAYHLGRPGSELDPITKQPVERGLAEASRELQPQLRLAVATLRLDSDQRTRLLSAMLGSITELKAYSMLAPRSGGGEEVRRSTVAGFDRSLQHLFPEVEEDVEASLDVAERMLMLKRRLDERLAQLPAEEPPAERRLQKKSWWPFGRS
jgi:hypothetical protein